MIIWTLAHTCIDDGREKKHKDNIKCLHLMNTQVYCRYVVYIITGTSYIY